MCAVLLFGTEYCVPPFVWHGSRLETLKHTIESTAVNRAISLDMATIVTGVSRRTLWRRLDDGKISRQRNDARGRAMLTLDDIAPMLCIPIGLENYELLVGADRGDADAQNDLAQLFLEFDRPDIAAHWFQLAAGQQHADAMHNMSALYLKGIGVDKGKSQALMWLSKAAAHGHVIAKAQLAAWAGVS